MFYLSWHLKCWISQQPFVLTSNALLGRNFKCSSNDLGLLCYDSTTDQCNGSKGLLNSPPTFYSISAKEITQGLKYSSLQEAQAKIHCKTRTCNI